MRWDRMRWDRMRWDRMRWDRMRWDRMRWDRMRWDRMRWDRLEWLGTYGFWDDIAWLYIGHIGWKFCNGNRDGWRIM